MNIRKFRELLALKLLGLIDNVKSSQHSQHNIAIRKSASAQRTLDVLANYVTPIKDLIHIGQKHKKMLKKQQHFVQIALTNPNFA